MTAVFRREIASYFKGVLGYLLGAASVVGMFKAHTLLGFFVPLLALGLPLFDTAFAFIRRALHGKNPLAPDRGHLHHRLLDRGLDQRSVVRLLCALSALLGLTAVMLAWRGAAARALAALFSLAAASAALALLRARLYARRLQQ